MISDTFILGKTTFPAEPVAADLSAQGLTLLEPGVYWQGDVQAYAVSDVIDIVGAVDGNDSLLHFLLLP